MNLFKIFLELTKETPGGRKRWHEKQVVQPQRTDFQKVLQKWHFFYAQMEFGVI